MGRHVRPSAARHMLRRFADRLRARATRTAAAVPGREAGPAAVARWAGRRRTLLALAGSGGVVVVCGLLLWLSDRPVGEGGQAVASPPQLAAVNGSSSAASRSTSASGVSATATTTTEAAPTPVAPTGSASSAAASATTGGASAVPPAIRWPVSGKVLAGFGWAFSPVFGDWQEHTGVDLQAPVDSPVAAPASGVVTAVRDDPLWGWLVSESLSDGYSTNVSALASAEVTQGETVEAGQPLGVVGPAPAAESNLPPHVFWQLFRDRRPVNPLSPGA